MDKKVRPIWVSGCDYYDEYPLLNKVDTSQTTFIGECPCGQGGCLVMEFYELAADSETSEEEE